MKLLAKSIVNAGQIEARKGLNANGIEFLLLDGDINNPHALQELVLAGINYKIVGIEAPDSFEGMPVDPTADDVSIRKKSSDFLRRCLDLADTVASRTHATVYFQFQFLFNNPFDKNGRSARVDRARKLDQVRVFYDRLTADADVNVQLENTIPVDPAYKHDRKYHCFVTIRPQDFVDTRIPIAFDIAHYAQTLNIWANAKKMPDGRFCLETEGKRFYIDMTDRDAELGSLVRAEAAKSGLKTAITKQIISALNFPKLAIGSVQFSDVKPGFGVCNTEAGYHGEGGMIDVGRVMREVADRHTPLIPEYHEADYNNPVVQRAVFAELRRLYR